MINFHSVYAGESTSFQGSEPLGTTGEIIPLGSLGKAAIGLKVISAEKKPLPLAVKVPGKIETIPSLEFDQHAPLAGRISKVVVHLGETVKAEQILVYIGSPELNELAAQLIQNEQELKSEYARSQSLLDDEVRQAEAKIQLAKNIHERNLKLLNERIIAQKDAQQSLADLQVAQTIYNTAVKKRDITLKALKVKLDVTLEPLRKRLVLLGVDKNDINDMLTNWHTITSVPVVSARSGVITDLNCSPGQSIDPSDRLLTVTDLNKVWATANVYEDDMARMKPGQKVSISVHALENETFEGRLAFIGTRVDQQTRTLPVRAEIENKQLKLKPDMFAELSIETSDSSTAILLPQDAVIERNGHSIVFIESKNGYQPSVVKTGRSFGDDIEILEGVTLGQNVVVRGAFQLAAELLKTHGRQDLFVKPTEADQFIDEKSEATTKNTNWQMLVVALIAFLCGIAATIFFNKHKSTSNK